MKRAWMVLVLLVACDRGDTSQWGNNVTKGNSQGSAPAAVAPKPVAPEEPAVETATLRIGDKVSAQWTNGHWYNGTLTAVYSDGTADVHYNDGDRSKGLAFEKIKLVKRPLFEAEVSSPKQKKKKSGLVEGASCAGVGWQHVCGGRCTDVKEDSANCGSCGHRCDSGYSCDGSGTCRDATGRL